MVAKPRLNGLEGAVNAMMKRAKGATLVEIMQPTSLENIVRSRDAPRDWFFKPPAV